jgi:hypothetical protein
VSMAPPLVPSTLFDQSCLETAKVFQLGLTNCDQLWTPQKTGQKLNVNIANGAVLINVPSASVQTRLLRFGPPPCHPSSPAS